VLRTGRVLALTEDPDSNTVSGKALDLTNTIGRWVKPYFVCGSDAPGCRAKPRCLRKTNRDEQAESLIATFTQPQGLRLRSAHSLARQAGMDSIRLTFYGKPMQSPFADGMQVRTIVGGKTIDRRGRKWNQE